MDFRKIMEEMGAPDCPPELVRLAEGLEKDPAPACDPGLLEALQRDHALCGPYYPLVRQALEEVNADPARSLWVKAVTAFCRGAELGTVKKLPIPPANGCLAGDFMPFFPVVNQLPEAIREYERRGFHGKELALTLGILLTGISIVEQKTGRPGVNKLYFNWFHNVLKIRMFQCGSLNFELIRLPDTALYLENRATGELLPLALTGVFHRSGTQMLGNVGFADPEGAFEVSFREDGEAFYGYPSRNCVVASREERFSKKEWRAVMRPGDWALNCHIPRRADLSPETTRLSFRRAMEWGRERFPELGLKGVRCSSWMLSPQLTEILGEDSRIAQFLNNFAKLPYKSNGKAVFGFVFPQEVQDPADLPEDTSLQRKLKALYLSGSCLHGAQGALLVKKMS